MKRLVLLRHAKSDWDADYGADHDRPLNDRGVRSAEAMGRFLAEVGQVPDTVISSTAVRARTTAELAIAAGGWNRSIRTDERIYGGSAGDILLLVQDLPDDLETAMLVGHNPTWEMLAGALIGGGSIQMKTATAAAVDFMSRHWRNVSPGRGTLAWLVQARLFLDGG
ncbi:MAG: histidine phosphatase family protein [Acidimicrobiia bacterium]|nr:histidine phosphatase family protein [Acidimicrobiia bacterium]